MAEARAAALGSAAPLAYEIVSGALVRWSLERPEGPHPPTAVLVHGIMGMGRNWKTFANDLAQANPSWQFILVDLPCHGASAGLPPPRGGGSGRTVRSSAQSVLHLLGHLRLMPRVLIGHSFGGKVVLSMLELASKPLPPVRAWVLDVTPSISPPLSAQQGVGEGGGGADRPADLLDALLKFPTPAQDRRDLVQYLVSLRFSAAVANWAASNLTRDTSGAYVWLFDLQGIRELFEDYCSADMWHIVDDVPDNAQINFVRAGRSIHRWAGSTADRISSARSRALSEGRSGSVNLFELPGAGHWVQTDDPAGLQSLLQPSFEIGGRVGTRPYG